jgi:hypothetical protein
MAYLMLVGTGGWTQRWEVAAGKEEAVAAELVHVGTDGTGQLPLLDPESDAEVTFVVAWGSVAAAVIIPSDAVHAQSRGQYA